MRSLLPVLIAAAVVGCASQHHDVAGALPTGPLAGDSVLSPFYAVPPSLPDRPGVMLRREPIAAQPELTAAGRQERILYTSTDARWQSGVIPVSGTLYLPKGVQPSVFGVSDLAVPKGFFGQLAFPLRRHGVKREETPAGASMPVTA